LSDLVVVKVGGSLFDLPELGPRLTRWLVQLAPADVLLVPGGGPTADVVRGLDARHGLGEEKSHWLALRALAFNAHFLASLLHGSTVVESVNARRGTRHSSSRAKGPTQPVSRPRVEYGPVHLERLPHDDGSSVAVLDPFGFCLTDKPTAALPHTWAVTSDSIAARVAIASGARRLILMKSVTIPSGMDWREAAERGFVDAALPSVIHRSTTLEVRVVNLRAPNF
jgi:aspartokinase-like uncharacterized kinase